MLYKDYHIVKLVTKGSTFFNENEHMDELVEFLKNIHREKCAIELNDEYYDEVVEESDEKRKASWKDFSLNRSSSLYPIAVIYRASDEANVATPIYGLCVAFVSHKYMNNLGEVVQDVINRIPAHDLDDSNIPDDYCIGFDRNRSYNMTLSLIRMFYNF